MYRLVIPVSLVCALVLAGGHTSTAANSRLTSDTYTVTVHTGDRDDAGTDANVRLVLFGPGCVIASTPLNNPGRNDFERNATDVFNVSGHNLGSDSVSAIEISHDNSHPYAGWFAESIKVANARTGASKTFTIHHWLAKDERPYAINYYSDGRELDPLPDTNPSVVRDLPTSRCDDARQRPQTSQISITGVEVTQGIQTVHGPEIPLVAHKRTYVRVYVKSGGGDVHGASASLQISGVDGTFSPDPVGGPVVIRASGSDRTKLGDSFLFSFVHQPNVTRPGTRTITVHVTPPSSFTQAGSNGPSLLTYSRPVTFHDLGSRSAITLEVLSLGYSGVYDEIVHQEPSVTKTTTAGRVTYTWPPKPASALDQSRDLAVNLLPLTGITLHTLGTLIVPCGSKRQGYGQWNCDDGLENQARDIATKKIDTMYPGGGHWIVLLQPNRACNCGAHVDTPRGNHVMNVQLNSPYSTTLAHEVSHGYGAMHTPNVHDDHDLGYPRVNGLLGPYVGLQYQPNMAPTPISGGTTGDAAADIMSYNSVLPLWVSPYTYCKVFNGVSAGQVRCASGLDSTGGSPFPYDVPPA